jgi:hypothetical protein
MFPPLSPVLSHTISRTRTTEIPQDPAALARYPIRSFITLRRWLDAGNDPNLHGRAVNALTELQSLFGDPKQFRYAATIGDVQEYCLHHDLLEAKNLGKKTVAAIKVFFAHYGIALCDNPSRPPRPPRHPGFPRRMRRT